MSLSVYLVAETQEQIASPFWNFLNRHFSATNCCMPLPCSSISLFSLYCWPLESQTTLKEAATVCTITNLLFIWKKCQTATFFFFNSTRQLPNSMGNLATSNFMQTASFTWYVGLWQCHIQRIEISCLRINDDSAFIFMS